MTAALNRKQQKQKKKKEKGYSGVFSPYCLHVSVQIKAGVKGSGGGSGGFEDADKRSDADLRLGCVDLCVSAIKNENK